MTTDNVYRIPAPFGNRIDRTQPLNFTFDGHPYQGYLGDTLASALYANGVRLISRSFKYHRPRGAWSFAGLDANAYVQVGDQPSVAADQLALYDGLEAKAQNVWGSLVNDKGSYTGLLARFLPVGFYYHAFFRPKGVWRYWERLFRRTAGLGKISRDTPPGYFDKQYLFADVAVIGAGPAGMEAALSAAEQGADVILMDDGPVLGGSLNYARFGRRPDEISSFLEELSGRVIESNRIRVLTNTTCSGWFGDNWLSLDSVLENRSRLYKLRAREVIACTGSVEQPIVFRNNDLPGILPASGAQRLIRQYGVRPGNQATIVTANREGYDLCRDLLDCGVGISAVIDLNEHQADPQTCDWLKEHGIGVLTAHAVIEAVPGPGNRSITGVIVKPLADVGIHEGEGQLFSCDTLITSAGYSPLAQLLCHSGGRMIYDREVHSFRLDTRLPHAHLAGSINHRYDLDVVLRDGQAAGMAAAMAAGYGADSDQAINAGNREYSNEKVNHPYPIFAHPDGKDFVDFDEDITVSDLKNAVADGFEHPELAKRYSTTAMGPSQGRLSALNALRIVLKARGHGSEDSGNPEVTTQRPPFKPVSFGVLAGRSFQPERLTPMHDWHLEHGATMMPAGLWQRPAFYGLAENRDQQVIDEVAVVRNNVGLIDVSTLGGIEVRVRLHHR
jgi:sarcosine oxidase subunit alpha